MSVATEAVAWRSWLFKAVAVLRLGRPKFLLGGAALYGLGALAAQRSGSALDRSSFFWGLLAVLAIQLMTHYSNDYFDYEADRANPNPTRWSGGSQVLIRGELPRSVALWAALTMAGLAVLAILGLYVTSTGQHESLLLLAVMLVLSWSYSSPPLRLHTRGLGEIAVALIVPLLTPLSGFTIQANTIRTLPLLLSVPLSMLLLAMLLTLQFPDETGDKAVGKRTWVVLFGPKRVARLCILLVVLAFVATFASVQLGVPNVVAKAWLLLTPLAAFQLWRMLANDWRRPQHWSRLELGAVALFFFSVLVDLAALYTLT